MKKYKDFKNKDEKRNSKKRLTKGAFGKIIFIGEYKTLKVLPRSKRTKDNCNSHGVQK